MKLNHILTTALAFGLLASQSLAVDPAMCGAPSAAAPASAPTKEKSSVQRNAEELVSQLAPEQQSELLILLNEASEEGLLEIKGIAASKANAIIQARPIQSLSGLVDVKGIGVTTLARILSHDPAETSSKSSSEEPMVSEATDKEPS
jgi:DNA uptake protein ComE-like DNA-binding protein